MSNKKPIPRPVNAADPVALATWAIDVRAHLSALRHLIDDSLAAKGSRRNSRRYLRREIGKGMRALASMVDDLAPVETPTNTKGS